MSHYDKTLRLEENHLFQGRLTTAPEIWLWDQLLAPVLKSYPFEVTELAAVPEMARLKLWIQGTTDLAVEPDHHVPRLRQWHVARGLHPRGRAPLGG